MKSILKGIQYDLLDFIEGHNEELGEGDSDSEPSYTTEDVTACIKLLLEFLSAMESAEQTLVSATAHVRELILALDELNEKCDGCLIETAQREEISDFIEKVFIAENVTLDTDLSQELRQW